MTEQRVRTKHEGTDDKGTFRKDTTRRDECGALDDAQLILR